MPTFPRIPAELKVGPFTVADARRAGVSPTSLRGRSWVRLQRGLYCWSGVASDRRRLLASLQSVVQGSVFGGRTAAWLLGIDVDPTDPIELIVPRSSGVRSRRGLYVRRVDLAATDVLVVRGIRVTSPARMLSDLCTRLTGADALAMVDAVIRLKLADQASLARSPGCLGALAVLAEPAESPMETRLRWLLLKAGLPRPEVQRSLHDCDGQFLGRADLYYESAQLVIEYDGGNHRDRLVDDNRRQNRLVESGFSLLRFTADDVYSRPDTIVTQVRRALSAGAALSARRRAAAPR